MRFGRNKQEPPLLDNHSSAVSLDDIDEDSSYGPAPPPPPPMTGMASDEEEDMMPEKDDPPEEEEDDDGNRRYYNEEGVESPYTTEDEGEVAAAGCGGPFIMEDDEDVVEDNYQHRQRAHYGDGNEYDDDDDEYYAEENGMDTPPTALVQRMMDRDRGSSSRNGKGGWLRWALILSTACCCLIVLAVVLGVGFGTGAFLSSSSSGDTSRAFDRERADTIRGILQSQSLAPTTHHDDTGSAESEAMHWLVTEPAFADVGTTSLVDQLRLAQLYALGTVYHSNDQQWVNDEGWLTTDNECEWYGVSCVPLAVDEGGQMLNVVTGLDLSSNNLGGSIPRDIVMLEFLQDLDVSGNDMEQSIEDIDWSKLGFLSTLRLGGNNFSGDLGSVTVLGESLRVLSVPENNFAGGLPDFRDLSGLLELDVEANQFGGPIPASLAAIPLQILRLGFNNWAEAEIPPFVYTMRSLRELSLRRSNIFGNLQGAIGSLQNLSVLLLEGNALSGLIPNVLFTGIPSLYRFTAAGNNFVGPMPDLSASESLAYLDLTANDLTGPLPDLSGVPNLVSLRLGDNALSGQLPASIVNLLQLEVLDLSRNGFSGPLPINMGGLFNLRTLNLSANLRPDGTGFGGPIPESLGNLRNLRRLEVRSNLFTGELPNSLVNLDSIMRVDVRFNQLRGVLPDVVAEAWADTLEEGYFSNTQMVGPMPEAVCSGDMLRVLETDCDWECACCTMDCRRR